MAHSQREDAREVARKYIESIRNGLNLSFRDEAERKEFTKHMDISDLEQTQIRNFIEAREEVATIEWRFQKAAETAKYNVDRWVYQQFPKMRYRFREFIAKQ